MLIGLGVVLVLIAGCTMPVRVQVDALAAAGGVESGLRYRLVNSENENEGLRWQYTANLVERALEMKGYRREHMNADAVGATISVKTHISEPLTETREYSEPVHLVSGGYHGSVRTAVRDSSGNVSGYVQTPVYIPRDYYFAGYRDRSVKVVVYEKTLMMSAMNGDGEELWNIELKLIDDGADLRKALPYLLSAALPYIGNSTESAVIVEIKEDAESLSKIRGEL